MILCANPRAQYAARRAEIDAAVLRVLDKGRYVLGEEVRAFEDEFASYLGAAYAVGVGSGTEALHLALAALEIGPGDEVITVSHTAVATVAAIELAGATPVLVDVEPDYFTLDPAKLEAAVSPRTKAIIPVHLYGQPADLMPILAVGRRHGIGIIEDCAQAHGALYHGKRVGTFGEVACFSFYPTKNLGGLGDGGMVVTDRSDVVRRVRMLREYGWADRYVSQVPGWNSRLDEIQAAILRVKLRHLDEDNDARARVAALYQRGLSHCELILPRVRDGATHVYHLYVVRTARRDSLQRYLQDNGIGVLVHYPVPIHLQPAYRSRLGGGDCLPETEQAARQVLSLPVYPEIGDAEVQTVAAAIREFEEEQHD